MSCSYSGTVQEALHFHHHLSMDCFWCEIVKGDLVLKEHEAAKWLTSNELNNVDWLPADITLIKNISEGL